MALAAQDGTIKIWNLTDDSLLENLTAHKVELIGCDQEIYQWK